MAMRFYHPVGRSFNSDWCISRSIMVVNEDIFGGGGEEAHPLRSP